jgi:2-methylfumaryl-CoA isomerase
MTYLLAGLRIIEGSAFVAAPLGGMTLAQLGADVIRFDDIGGGLDANRWPVSSEGRSIFWASLNKGKRSIAVDLRSPEGREIVSALISAPGPDAGIFSTNLPARGWLSYEALAEKRDDLIALNIIGTRDGEAQVDYTVNAVTGFPMITGPEGHEGPINSVVPAWDIATGYAAAVAILAAERHRARTGTGQLVKIALQDVALAATAALGYLGEAQVNKVDRPRIGNHIFGTFASDFATRDGRRFIVCVFTARQLDALAEAGNFAEAFDRIERENGLKLRREADRWHAREAIAEVIRPWASELTLAEAAEKLTAAGALWAPYKMPRELVDNDPLIAGNPMFAEINQPGLGQLWSAASPFTFSAAPRAPVRPAPELGEHTEEILADVLGLPGAEIGRLHDQGVVRAANGR